VERLLVDCPHSLVVERSCLLISLKIKFSKEYDHSASFAASWHGSNFKHEILRPLAFLTIHPVVGSLHRLKGR
jgi:hypothetical protein